MSRTRVALYHHLPPGGADRAMYQLALHTRDDFAYTLFRVELDDRDPYHGAAVSPIEAVVEDIRTVRARSGGASRVGRWGMTVPSILSAERKIAAAIEAQQFEVLVAHHQRFTQSPGVMRRIDIPSVYMVQEPRRRSFEYDLRHEGADDSWKSLLRRAPLKLVEQWATNWDVSTARMATTLLCNSEHSREYIWRAYGRDATVLPLGVDPNRFQLPEIDERDNEILVVGSLDRSKAPDLAVRSVAGIDEMIRPRLRFVHNRTDSGTRRGLEALAKSLNVETVFDTDATDSSLVQRYQRALALLCTARLEPLGLTPLESMACGTPVVAVREGGFRETIRHGLDGLLVDRDARALAAAMTEILTGGFRVSRTDLRSGCFERYSWPRAAEIYRDSILSTLDRERVTATQ